MTSLKLFLNSVLYKTNRFQVAVRLFSNRERQNMVRTSVTHSAAPRVPRQLGIYLLNRWRET